MQGIMTIIFGQISHKLSGRRGHTATDSRSSEDMHPVIGDAGFAAMLREIDAFSKQLQAVEAQHSSSKNNRPASMLKRLHLGKNANENLPKHGSF